MGADGVHSQHPSAHRPRSRDPKPGDEVFGMAMVPATAELCHSSWPSLQSNFNSSILQLQIPFLHGIESGKKTGHVEGRRNSIFSNKTSLL